MCVKFELPFVIRIPAVACAKYIVIVCCLNQAYASALAFCTIATRRKLAAITEEHLMVVLISAFVVFAYRDVWPLMTFTQTPEDGRMGSLLWTQVALLAFAAVFVPLTIPKVYTPLDPQVSSTQYQTLPVIMKILSLGPTPEP